MSLLHYVPKGDRLWDVKRDTLTVGRIGDGFRGLELTTLGFRLTYLELDAISTFMRSHSELAECTVEEARRRLR
jgi:hypothetical protein